MKTITITGKTDTLAITPIGNKTLKTESLEVTGEDLFVSDEYHTMEELYTHRIHLFIALMKVLDSYVTPLSYPYARCWKSKFHDDGSEYEGWFLAGITITKQYFQGEPATQHISYHLPNKYWDKIHVMELTKAPVYDGYTPDDVLERLLKI